MNKDRSERVRNVSMVVLFHGPGAGHDDATLMRPVAYLFMFHNHQGWLDCIDWFMFLQLLAKVWPLDIIRRISVVIQVATYVDSWLLAGCPSYSNQHAYNISFVGNSNKMCLLWAFLLKRELNAEFFDVVLWC